MDNILDSKTNKRQALIKIQIAKENLEGATEALSEYRTSKIDKALGEIEMVLFDLKKELKINQHSF